MASEKVVVVEDDEDILELVLHNLGTEVKIGMIRLSIGLSLALLFVAGIATAQTGTVQELEKRLEALEKQQGDNALKLYWKEGIRFDSANGEFKMKLGGRIQNDWAFFDLDNDLEDQVGEFDDGAEFRRARLYLSGTIYENIEFKAQYDFAGGDADFKDVYLGLTDLPIGGIRVGHFKEPFSLEELTSNNYITFMERSLPIETFAPSRNTGLMLHNHVMDDRLTYAVGVFRDSAGDEFGNEMGDEYNFTGRITGTPWFEEKGTRMVHLGLGASVRNEYKNHLSQSKLEVDQEVGRFRSRPEAHLASARLVDTNMLQMDELFLVGAEAALVLGPFSLQGEYIVANADGDEGSDRDFDDDGAPDYGYFDSNDLQGFYIAASYFVTGEHRPYKTAEGAFSRVKPAHNYLNDGGPGAWEVTARYSHLDLEDDNLNGGEQDDITLGLNWYLNPNARVMLNYVYADAEEKYDGEMHAFQTRFQIDF